VLIVTTEEPTLLSDPSAPLNDNLGLERVTETLVRLADLVVSLTIATPINNTKAMPKATNLLWWLMVWPNLTKALIKFDGSDGRKVTINSTKNLKIYV
jgi:hypothetical protein